jgi:hypothetical protein
MAGWDGDALAGSMEQALERQQEAAEARQAQRQEKSSPEDRECKSREKSLRLSKARIEEQLGRATNPAHRAMLERALKSLETESTSDAASQTQRS